MKKLCRFMVAVAVIFMINACGKESKTNNLLLLLGLAGNTSDPPINIDPGFGFGGPVLTDINQDDEARAVAIQSDGKIVAAGKTKSTSNDYSAIAVVRYNTDGSLDESFGTGGKVITDITSMNDYANAVVIDGSNKIVVAGYANGDFAVVRYTPAGVLDTTFDTDGIATTDIRGQVGNDEATSIAIDANNNRIMVAGNSYDMSGVDYDDFAVVRYNANGTLDTSFDIDGKVTTDINSHQRDFGRSIAIQSDGKILVAGYTSKTGGYSIAIVRYTSSGVLDSSFDSDGKKIYSFDTSDEAHSIVAQSDGKIVIAGHTLRGTTAQKDFTVARITSSGSLDDTFGILGGGKVFIDFAGSNDEGSALAIDANGKYVVVGTAQSGSAYDFGIARINATGWLDTTFGTNGKARIDIGGSEDRAYAVAIQTDGRIIMAGYSNKNGTKDFALVRI